jgi:hypothetical protein
MNRGVGGAPLQMSYFLLADVSGCPTQLTGDDKKENNNLPSLRRRGFESLTDKRVIVVEEVTCNRSWVSGGHLEIKLMRPSFDSPHCLIVGKGLSVFQ